MYSKLIELFSTATLVVGEYDYSPKQHEQDLAVDFGTDRRLQAAEDRHTALRSPDRRLGPDPRRAGYLHRHAARLLISPMKKKTNNSKRWKAEYER